MGMAASTYWTADMVRALPDDGNRYEVVYGELLATPAPRMLHQIVVSGLTVALSQYLRFTLSASHLASRQTSPGDATTFWCSPTSL
jgi:hypothetical protein